MIPFDQPSLEEQQADYTVIGAENREREYLATQFLRAFGASWIEVETAIELFWPQSSSPQYLNRWASESLDRLSRTAHQRRDPETVVGGRV